jgi:hypothetical protein
MSEAAPLLLHFIQAVVARQFFFYKHDDDTSKHVLKLKEMCAS